MNKLLLLLTLAPCLAFGQLTYVPDDNFEQALIDLGYDTGTPDDSVPTANISSVTYLNVNSNGGSGTVTVLMNVENNGSFTPGDVNMDGQINVQDVILMINIALDILTPTQEQMQAADLNSDGIINILDIIDLVNMVLEN